MEKEVRLAKNLAMVSEKMANVSDFRDLLDADKLSALAEFDFTPEEISNFKLVPQEKASCYCTVLIGGGLGCFATNAEGSWTSI